MLQPIHYDGQRFIIINDITNYIFYFFDFDSRSYSINMEFEHFHSFFEIHVLLSPDALHYIKGVPYQIKQNDFVLLAPSLLHKTSYLEGEPSNRLIIQFMYPDDGYIFSDAYQKLLSPFFCELPIYRFSENQTSTLNQLINHIVTISRHVGTPEMTGTDELMIHNVFTEFLYYFNQFKQDNLYKAERPTDQITQRIYAVSNYIHNHYMEDLTLEDLAKEHFMSPYYLSHQFKNVTGYTITHYIHMVRIRNCQFQLINSSKKITEIAADCGFTSFSQFNRIFQKLCSESPSEYRKRRKAIL